MKKMGIIVIIILSLFITGCNAGFSEKSSNTSFHMPREFITFMYQDFEEAVQDSATDVVIARFIGQRPFGVTLTEFEFEVYDRLLGEAEDRIFVYTTDRIADYTTHGGRSFQFNESDLRLRVGVYYMIPLYRIARVGSSINSAGFTFIRNAIIDIQNPPQKSNV